MKITSLSNLYYLSQTNLQLYYDTGLQVYLFKATNCYYTYKKNKGRKCIDRLENELVKLELEYI